MVEKMRRQSRLESVVIGVCLLTILGLSFFLFVSAKYIPRGGTADGRWRPYPDAAAQPGG